MDAIKKTIYLTRESFCMGDDATAPNLVKYTWHDYPKPFVENLFFILEDYLGCNLPGFFWRGYANGQRIADVTLKRHGKSFSRSIDIADGWEDLLRQSQCIHFLNAELDDKDSLPLILEEGYYTYDEADKVYMEYPRYFRECNNLKHVYDETNIPY